MLRVCFDVGMFVCFLLPGPLPEVLGPSVVEETQQDGHQQPTEKTAADVNNKRGYISLSQIRENLKG